MQYYHWYIIFDNLKKLTTWTVEKRYVFINSFKTKVISIVIKSLVNLLLKLALVLVSTINGNKLLLTLFKQNKTTSFKIKSRNNSNYLKSIKK